MQIISHFFHLNVKHQVHFEVCDHHSNIVQKKIPNGRSVVLFQVGAQAVNITQ